jgi:2-amino-4-hydroxy-6-hydroxymethyldihydropteridine diphosphokinase
MKHHLFLATGSNLGDRQQNLRSARQAIRRLAEVEKVSSIYETEPWGYTDQPAFLNQVLAATTLLSPFEVLHSIKSMEGEIGRTPTFRYGPRVIDIDILLYDDLILDDDRLILPHPRMTERAFVLVPLDEIAPQHLHPVFQQTIHDLLQNLDTSSVRLFSKRTDKERP